MDEILVTVIVTTYDRPYLLSQALQTVVDQTHKNLEIIVVDGLCSKANREVVGSFDDNRIFYVCNKDTDNNLPRYGQVQRCRNLGVALSNSKSKYIAMLDDDDRWEDNKIKEQLAYAELFDADLVISHMKIYSGTSFTIDKPIFNPTYEDLLKSFNLSHTSSFFLNKESLLEVGGFNEKLRSMHEYDIALKIAKKGCVIVTVPEPLMIASCDNTKDRSFYYTKIAEVFDMYRLYGKDMLPYLGVRGFTFNIVKSGLLVALFSLGFIFKEKIWKIIFHLKEMYQEKSR